MVALLSASRMESREKAGGLLVGSAKRIITPEPLLPVSGGMGAPKPVREKRGDLTVRAMVVQKGPTTMALVGIDLIGFPSVLGDKVRTKVPRISPDNILIGASHTHSAPDAYAFPDGKGGHTAHLPYLEMVCQKAADAINEALDRLEPAHLKIGTDEAKGRIAYNYYAPDLYDRRMSVIQAVRASDGKAIATLVNYAIHPEVLGNEVGILSPDASGPLCDRLESVVGGVAVFLNGAQGGMVTADNRDLKAPRDSVRGYWNDFRTWEECLRIGHLMADEAVRIVAGQTAQTDPEIACLTRRVSFPVESPELWNVITLSPLKYPHGPGKTIQAQINLVTLGNARCLTIPGEALPNIGFYLKRKMGGQHNLVFGLTNEAFGYILTQVDFQSFPRYDYVSRVSLGEKTGEILMSNALEMIATLPKDKKNPPSESR